MLCAGCGSDNPPGFRFCGQCGRAIDSGEPGLSAGAPQRCAVPATSASEPAAAAAVPPRASPQRDERRPVTVLFADLSGFTRMSSRLDAEQVHELMNECFAGLGGVIQDEGGHIDKFIGDSVMALFGAPAAHEDDPERACRAALGMQAFIAALSRTLEARIGCPLRIRIGINQGPVVAGRVGAKGRMDYTVMGDAVNVASRLESSAEPGTIQVSRAVHEATRHRFEYGPPRMLQVKGKDDPVPAWVLAGERRRPQEPATAAPRIPMVGREAELRWLRDRIAPGPVAGPATAPRWVEIVGEAGVGKTRLVREAVGRCPELRLLVVGAVADTGRRPYGLLRRTMIELLLFATGDEAAFDDRGRFERALLAVDKSLAPYAAALWHVAAPTRAAAPAPDPDPVSLRRTIERGTSALLAALTAQHPGVVLLLDSLHHADPASLALLRALTGSAAAAAPLLIAAGRTSPHDDDAAATLTLLPLPPAAAGQMLDALTRGAALPEALRRSILERSGGVPLFVEELVQSLLESGALDCGPGRDGCVLTQEPAELRLPTSLHSALLSRLDAQPEEERELLTQLSVQGVEFDLDIAQRVRAESRWAGPPVAPLASSLERARMIARRKGAAAQARGLFRLALMQEAAYGTLVRRDRRALHELVAEALVELAGGAERVAPTALAWHEEMAERWERAAAARLRAGDQAAHLFLNDEAVGHYDRVLQLAEKAQAEVPARDRTQWTHLAAAAHGGAARIKLLTGDYPESLRRAERMREAAAREDDRAECLRIIAAIHARRGDAEEARRILEGVVHAAESADAGATKERVMGRVWLDLAVLHHRADRLDDAERCVAQARPGAERALQLEVDLVEGRILHTRGRFDAARAIYERAHHGATAQGSLSQRALAANRLGNAARDQGEYPTARRWYQQALADWSHIGDAEAVAGAWNNLGNVEMSIGERDAAAECFRRSLEASRRIGNVHGAALASANLAILAAERRDGEAAVAAAGAALDSLGPAGDRLLRGLVAVVLGEGLHLCGRLDEADLVFRRVLHEFTAHDHPLAAAGAERGCGRVALARGATDEAIALLDRAHDRFTAIGRAQEAARTRLCLARALHASSRREQAMQHASAALHELEAMGAAQDAEQARLLLAALHAPV